ncbi:MAG TPA: helix-turn-helix domain-containing protein [Usitatibacter sp.]|nr:helix-turn-helix domain-containing protein [Usitatibacter sp.]
MDPVALPTIDAARGAAVPQAQVACAACAFAPLCRPRGRGADDPSPVEARRRVSRGQTLFAAGAPQSSIYAVRAGFLKSVVSCDDEDHIADFLLPGDVAGLDRSASGLHASTAVALSDCELCEISTYRAEMLCDFSPRVGTHIRRLTAEQLAIAQQHALWLSCLPVRERLARFLLDLGRRWQERGYSAHAYALPMTRRDIAEHLGLTPETVSRLLSQFHERGWIRQTLRSIEILDEAALRGKLPV